MKPKEDTKSLAYTTIAEVVTALITYVDKQREMIELDVTLDFTPPHSMEWFESRKPVKCFPLTDSEQFLFWEELYKQLKL